MTLVNQTFIKIICILIVSRNLYSIFLSQLLESKQVWHQNLKSILALINNGEFMFKIKYLIHICGLVINNG